MNEFKKRFKVEVEKEYRKRLEELNIGSKFYLWARRNYV